MRDRILRGLLWVLLWGLGTLGGIVLYEQVLAPSSPSPTPMAQPTPTSTPTPAPAVTPWAQLPPLEISPTPASVDLKPRTEQRLQVAFLLLKAQQELLEAEAFLLENDLGEADRWLAAASITLLDAARLGEPGVQGALQEIRTDLALLRQDLHWRPEVAREQLRRLRQRLFVLSY